MLAMEHDDDEYAGFLIQQDESDGSIVCSNLHVTYRDCLVTLASPLNSRLAYPLRFAEGDAEGPVFKADGTLSAEFRAWLDAPRRECHDCDYEAPASEFNDEQDDDDERPNFPCPSCGSDNTHPIQPTT